MSWACVIQKWRWPVLSILMLSAWGTTNDLWFGLTEDVRMLVSIYFSNVLSTGISALLHSGRPIIGNSSGSSLQWGPIRSSSFKRIARGWFFSFGKRKMSQELTSGEYWRFWYDPTLSAAVYSVIFQHYATHSCLLWSLHNRGNDSICRWVTWKSSSIISSLTAMWGCPERGESDTSSFRYSHSYLWNPLRTVVCSRR